MFCFPTILTKGHNFYDFLFAVLDVVALPRRVCFCWRCKFFSLILGPSEKEAKIQMARLLPLKVYQLMFVFPLLGISFHNNYKINSVIFLYAVPV